MGDVGKKANWTPPDMRSVIFDDQGEMWDAQSRRLAHDLHASIAGEELVDYVIRNLGFVAAKDLNGSLRISLRPAVVSPIAFSALLYWLHDRTADRVLISFCDREWTHELMRSRDEAVRKLMTRVDFGQGARDGDFLQQDLPLDSLPDTVAAARRARHVACVRRQVRSRAPGAAARARPQRPLRAGGSLSGAGPRW